MFVLQILFVLMLTLLVSLFLLFQTRSATRPLVSKLTTASLKGLKLKSSFSASAYLSAYRLLLMGTEDGKVVVTC